MIFDKKISNLFTKARQEFDPRLSISQTDQSVSVDQSLLIDLPKNLLTTTTIDNSFNSAANTSRENILDSQNSIGSIINNHYEVLAIIKTEIEKQKDRVRLRLVVRREKKLILISKCRYGPENPSNINKDTKMIVNCGDEGSYSHQEFQVKKKTQKRKQNSINFKAKSFEKKEIEEQI